jgi:hypothetical protein
VFADPGNQEARGLLADCFEQLGYQAEAGTWRNICLTGAQELRDGIKKVAAPTAVSPELLAALPIEMIFDYLGVMLNGPRAAGKTIIINLDLTDTHQQYVLQVKNCVLNYFEGAEPPGLRKPAWRPHAGTGGAIECPLTRLTVLAWRSAACRVPPGTGPVRWIDHCLRGIPGDGVR